MGLGVRLLAVLVGLGSFGVGLWPVGVICMCYLLLPLARRKQREADGARASNSPKFARILAGLIIGVLGLGALASGGYLSPWLLLGCSLTILLWPALPFGPALAAYTQVPESVLLRSRWFPFAWAALAEVKPGPAEPARALSELSGSLLVFRGGSSFLVVRALALGRAGAEKRVASSLRDAARSVGEGAYLLPLDSSGAPSRLAGGFRSLKFQDKALAEGGIPAGAGILLVTRRGVVLKAGVYDSDRRPGASLPVSTRPVVGSPLVWEVLEGLHKRFGSPKPDAYSGFLGSFKATAGEHLGGRLVSFEGEGPLTVEGLGGLKVELTRPQLRAIVEVYR